MLPSHRPNTCSAPGKAAPTGGRWRAPFGAWVAPFIDGLAYPLRVSHYAELLNPLWASHQLRARIEHFHEETGNARTLTLRPGKGWRTHRAGQHVRVAVAIDGRTYTRTYTISSAPERDDGCFTITVKAIAGGRVSPHLVRSVGIGDHLTVGLPQGDFHLPDARPVLPLFITAGSGITPARAMLASLIAQERMPETVHVHYAPREREVIFGQELRQLAQHHRRYRFEQVFTRQGAGPGAPTAHFHAAQLERLCPDWRERDVYACGPPALLAALQRHFTAERGKHRLHIERFVADFAATPADAVGGEVRFARSRVRATADQQTPLLRVAENEGMNPPHGCRMGICHSCDARLLSGCVRDLRTGRITTEAGSIVQPCVSAAAGDCELDL